MTGQKPGTAQDLPQPRYLRLTSASPRYGVSIWTLRDLIRQGLIAAKKQGKLVLVNVESADRHFDALPDATFAPLRPRDK